MDSGLHHGPVAGVPVRATVRTVQLLFDLRTADPTALTAGEAIRSLLAFGDRLVEVRRRLVAELAVQAPVGGEARGSLSDRLSGYLEQAVVFWNPNKQAAWVRIEGEDRGREVWEALPGARRRDGSFGRPDLDDPAYDHLLVWPRRRPAVPADLVRALVPWVLASADQGELWSLRWREGASAAEREAWTAAVGTATSRRQGLLVNPHGQDHRRIPGAVPVPLWAGGARGTGGRP